MSRGDILMNSIKTFYSDQYNSTILKDILYKRKGISLRYLEWFITNFSKKHDISYVKNDGKIFTVHCSYKATLNGYSKKLFDPFCRKDKIEFQIPGTEDAPIKTTIAQLNFIKWCITNNIITHIENNPKKYLQYTSALEKSPIASLDTPQLPSTLPSEF